MTYKEMPPLTKKIEFFFQHSLEQIVTSPTRTTGTPETPIDHLLTNSSHKVTQSGVKDHMHNKILVGSSKRLNFKTFIKTFKL